MTGEDSRADGSGPSPTVIRVARGRPTPEELAAVVTVLAAVTRGGASPRTPTGVGGWSAYWRSLGAPPPRSPSAWRSCVGP